MHFLKSERTFWNTMTPIGFLLLTITLIASIKLNHSAMLLCNLILAGIFATKNKESFNEDTGNAKALRVVLTLTMFAVLAILFVSRINFGLFNWVVIGLSVAIICYWCKDDTERISFDFILPLMWVEFLFLIVMANFLELHFWDCIQPFILAMMSMGCLLGDV